MTIKHVAFDLDGVLVDAMRIHRDAFLDALNSFVPGCLSVDEHDARLASLSTRQKLSVLVAEGSVPADVSELVAREKQRMTRDRVVRAPLTVPWLPALLDEIRSQGRRVALCTNSIRNTAVNVLLAHGLRSRFDAVVSSDDVADPKPAAEPYLAVARELDVVPNEIVALEDSAYGLRSARDAGCWPYAVLDPVRDLEPRRVLDWLSLVDRA